MAEETNAGGAVHVAKVTSVCSCYSTFCVLAFLLKYSKASLPLSSDDFSRSPSKFEWSSARLSKDSVSMSMSLFTTSLHRGGQCFSPYKMCFGMRPSHAVDMTLST